jgi:hypothetical protein
MAEQEESDADLKAKIIAMARESKVAQRIGAELREWADELSKHECNWVAEQLLVAAGAIEDGIGVVAADEIDDD